MSARIAPEPIGPVTTTPEFRPRPTAGEQQVVSAAEGPTSAGGDGPKAPGERFADVLPPLPPPPDPPGTMFAAAVVSGALSPRPQTVEELILRLGTAWSPPDSELRLADRKI